MPERTIPQHIGIIMDGNGRWAQNLGKPRSFGHREGLEAAKRITKAASELGIKYITLYVFSTENWKRTEAEVSFLMQLLKYHLKKEFDFYRENQTRVLHSGDITSLPDQVKKEINAVVRDTAGFKGLTVNLAINYGGRDEIMRAANRWLDKNRTSDSSINEKELTAFMDQPEVPDPDLIIRTAGEKRLSNFLLWESAYSEFYFSEKFWPEWTKKELEEAIREYMKRNRKFGAVPQEKKLDE